jgi:hypothetical protein
LLMHRDATSRLSADPLRQASTGISADFLLEVAFAKRCMEINTGTAPRLPRTASVCSSTR